MVWFGVSASSHAGIKVIPLSLLTRTSFTLLPDGKHAAPPTPNAGKVAQNQTLAELVDYLAIGKIQPLVASRIPLVQAARAHEVFGTRLVGGRDRKGRKGSMSDER